MRRHSVLRPRREVILGDDVVRVGVVVVSADTELADVEVSEGRRTDQRHADVPVEPRRAGDVRPVLFTLHDPVLHEVAQKHDLQPNTHTNVAQWLSGYSTLGI